MTFEEVKNFLDDKYNQYNTLSFIENDPVYIPHQFEKSEDIEIAGFFAATFAWGQRKTIINKSMELMRMMDYAPFDFVINHQTSDLGPFKHFVHRTFNGVDCIWFIKALQNIYSEYGGIGQLFQKEYIVHKNLKSSIIAFREKFIMGFGITRSVKHIADVSKNAAGKRLNMFLRWMIRNEGPVDFGLWKGVPSSDLFIPLDLHTGNVARRLGLLTRKQDDWKAVEGLTAKLREMDKSDPVKYDFALFGLGIYENF